jgi:hypothetical protein
MNKQQLIFAFGWLVLLEYWTNTRHCLETGFCFGAVFEKEKSASRGPQVGTRRGNWLGNGLPPGPLEMIIAGFYLYD